MAISAESPRYYASSKDNYKQLPLLLPFVAIFLLSFLFAQSLTNDVARNIMIVISLFYPVFIVLLIIFTILGSIRAINYYQIDSKGMRITSLGILHINVYWSEIESTGPVRIGNVDALGVMFYESVTRHKFGRKRRLSMFGWESVISYAYTKDGDSLADQVRKYTKTNLS
jgi:hypothetical protein